MHTTCSTTMMSLKPSFTGISKSASPAWLLLPPSFCRLLHIEFGYFGQALVPSSTTSCTCLLENIGAPLATRIYPSSPWLHPHQSHPCIPHCIGLSLARDLVGSSTQLRKIVHLAIALIRNC